MFSLISPKMDGQLDKEARNLVNRDFGLDIIQGTYLKNSFAHKVFSKLCHPWYIRLFYSIKCLGFYFQILIQRGPTKTAPLLINTIEMRVLWMEIKYIKSASRLLDRAWVNKGGLDLSKEVLWVSVGQRAAELPAIKARGQKKKFCRTALRGRSPEVNILSWNQ